MQVVVPNEVRERIGLSSLPDGDTPVVLNAAARAEQTAQATGNRLRDQNRQSNSADSSENPRNSQGDGRQQP
jgi:bifunctional DNA-binding transcriptional regulator/antitoxin component of YhaV-PrlF toxin-antitoxin module